MTLRRGPHEKPDHAAAIEARVNAAQRPSVDRGSMLVHGRCAQCGSRMIAAELVPLVNTVNLTCLCCGSDQVALP